MGKPSRSPLVREEPTTGRRCHSIPQQVWFIFHHQPTAPTPSPSILTSLTSRESAPSASSGATAASVWVWVWNRRRKLCRRFLLLRPSDPFHREDSVECSWRGIRLLRECAGARLAVEASEAGPSRLPGIWCSRVSPTAVSWPTPPTKVRSSLRSNLDCSAGMALRSLTCSTASNTFRSWAAKEHYHRTASPFGPARHPNNCADPCN